MVRPEEGKTMRKLFVAVLVVWILSLTGSIAFAGNAPSGGNSTRVQPLGDVLPGEE